MFRKFPSLPNCIVALSASIFFAVPLGAQEDSLETAIHTLARRTVVMMQTAPPVARGGCVAWENRAGISDGRSSRLNALFVAEVPGAQAAQQQDARVCEIRILLDRTPTRFVFSAQVSSSGGNRVAILELPRAESGSAPVPPVTLRLKKDLLWQQSERILDAFQLPATPTGPGSLVILSHDSVTRLEKDTNEWKPVRSWTVTSSAMDPRSPRGELAAIPDKAGVLRVLLPGKSCELDLQSDSAPSCQAATPVWRTRSHLSSTCDANLRELRASSGDWSSPDRISLLDAGSSALKTSAAETPTPGPVLSISDALSPQTGATATVFNIGSGSYDIYAITLDCSD